MGTPASTLISLVPYSSSASAFSTRLRASARESRALSAFAVGSVRWATFPVLHREVDAAA
jgi:hypothetical protein